MSRVHCKLTWDKVLGQKHKQVKPCREESRADARLRNVQGLGRGRDGEEGRRRRQSEKRVRKQLLALWHNLMVSLC